MKVSEMMRQAERMRQASSSIFWQVVPTREFTDTMSSIKDEQSRKLFSEVCKKIADKLKLSESEDGALNRIMQVVKNHKTWQPDMIRNMVFKAADSMGIKLPSGHF